jgi:pimeloyl-ACP methyl ester carboxylesterase
LGERYRLIALDLPGHGASAPAFNPDMTYTLPGYAALLTASTRELGIEDAVMVGWSLGGHILLEAANLLDKAAGFLLFGTPPISKPMAGDAFLPNPLFSCLFEKELNVENAAAVAASFFSADKRVPDFFAEAMLSTDGRARTALWQSVAEGSYADEVTVASNLSKPLAIVHGEADCLVNLAYIRQLSMPTLWRGEVQVIENAGHAPHWEQPERFNRLVEEFAEECAAATSVPFLH